MYIMLIRGPLPNTTRLPQKPPNIGKIEAQIGVMKNTNNFLNWCIMKIHWSDVL